MCLILIKIGKLIGLILAHEAINIWFYVGFKEIVYIYIYIYIYKGRRVKNDWTNIILDFK